MAQSRTYKQSSPSIICLDDSPETPVGEETARYQSHLLTETGREAAADGPMPGPDATFFSRKGSTGSQLGGKLPADRRNNIDERFGGSRKDSASLENDLGSSGGHLSCCSDRQTENQTPAAVKEGDRRKQPYVQPRAEILARRKDETSMNAEPASQPISISQACMDIRSPGDLSAEPTISLREAHADGGALLQCAQSSKTEQQAWPGLTSDATPTVLTSALSRARADGSCSPPPGTEDGLQGYDNDSDWGYAGN